VRVRGQAVKLKVDEGELRELVAAGKTITAIADKLGVDRGSIRRALNRYKISYSVEHLRAIRCASLDDARSAIRPAIQRAREGLQPKWGSWAALTEDEHKEAVTITSEKLAARVNTLLCRIHADNVRRAA